MSVGRSTLPLPRGNRGISVEKEKMIEKRTLDKKRKRECEIRRRWKSKKERQKAAES